MCDLLMQDVVMHGAGNRFLLHFNNQDPTQLFSQYDNLDGVLVLTTSKDADIEMVIINADGGLAEQCGNGLRCVALHAVRSQVVTGPIVTIKTPSGINLCKVDVHRNEVEVTFSKHEAGPISCDVTQGENSLPELSYVSFGNPNAVLWTKDDPIEIRDALAEKIVSSPAFKEGMNLHVARLDSENSATCASWERGVGATLASGTGGASVFIAAEVNGPFFVSSIGGVLSYKLANGVVTMTGPAGYV